MMDEFKFNKEDSNELKLFLSSLEYTSNPGLKFRNQGTILNLDDLSTKLGPYTYATITYLNPQRHPERKVRTVLGGVKKYLGHDESTFDFMKSLNIIHGIFRVMVIEYGKAVYKLLENEEVRKKITQDTIYTIPYLVRHERGHLVSVIQHSSFHQIKEGDGIATIQLNIFHVLPNYSYETLIVRPNIFHPIEGFFSKELKQIRDIAIPRILEEIEKHNKNRPFLTPSLYMTALELSKKVSAHKIAQKSHKRTDTIHTYSKQILNRVGNLFPGGLNFRTGSEAAFYLKELGFLDYSDHYIKTKSSRQ